MKVWNPGTITIFTFTSSNESTKNYKLTGDVVFSFAGVMVAVAAIIIVLVLILYKIKNGQTVERNSAAINL